MNTFKKIFCVLILFVFTGTNLYAQSPYFIDFQKILNQSDAGKKAQNELKKRLNQTVEKLNKTQKNLQDEEKKIIQQKKLISADEYKTKVDI